MQRLIDANALNKKFEWLKNGQGLKDVLFLNGAQAVVDGMSTVEPKRGEWIHAVNKDFRTCSVCRIAMGMIEGEELSRFKFCPFCGADMRKEEKG